jgi:parallel beta-helix repeat protein
MERSMMFKRFLCMSLIVASLAACGASEPTSQLAEAPIQLTAAPIQPTVAPAQAATDAGEHLTSAPPATPQAGQTNAEQPDASDTAALCDTPLSKGGDGVMRQPKDVWANVKYDAKEQTIIVGKGAEVTLRDIARSLGEADVLREVAPGEWLLDANMRIEEGAALRIAAPETHRLKLRSDDSGFVWIKAFGGQLEFSGVCVTSWDSARASYDEQLDDGRSFVLARDGAQLFIRDSEMSYLGYAANESYGVALRLKGTSGEIVSSRLGYNYYGLYTYQVSDLVIRGNEVHHSVRYGIDPHTESRRLLIEDNISHHNGKHGIILANGCTDSVIRNNTVYNNAMHGIVLFQGSNDNLVEGNTSYGNKYEGINVNESSDNTIRDNTVFDNAKAGIGVGQKSRDNLVEGNVTYGNREDGIALYSDAGGNTLQGNEARANARYGIHIKSDDNTIGEGNRVFANAVGVYVNASSPPDISLEDNQIYDNREEDVRVSE